MAWSNRGSSSNWEKVLISFTCFCLCFLIGGTTSVDCPSDVDEEPEEASAWSPSISFRLRFAIIFCCDGNRTAKCDFW